MKKKTKGNSPENYIIMPDTKAYSITLGQEGIKEKCKACNGYGFVVLEDGKKYTCPSCSGWGGHQVFKPQRWLLECNIQSDGKITSVDVKKNEIMYFFGCHGFKSENVFLTKSEAEKEIHKRNKRLIDLENIEKQIDE